MPENNNPFPPGAAVAAYLRDSGGDEQDLSVDQQEREIRAWCQARGLRLTQVFPDRARPGSSTVGREQFHAMIEHFKNRPPEAGLIVWRSNRLGRNVNDTQFYKADLRRRGYIVHSLMDDIPDGPAGQLVEFVLDWKDQVFLDQLSEDVRRGLRHNVETYGVIPGTPPRGFIRVPVEMGARRDGSPRIGYRWQPNPEEAPLVLRAFEMRAQGMALREIARQVPLYKSKNSWATFFDNELYTGTLRYGELTIPNYCPAIVPPELWQTVQAQRRITSARANPRRKRSRALLSGLVYCQECGHPYDYHPIGKWEYYACAHRLRTGQCAARHIPLPALDSEVIRLAREQMLDPGHIAAIEERARALAPERLAADKKALAQARAAHTRQKRELGHLAAAIRAHGYSETLGAELTRLETEERATREEIEDLTTRLRELDQPPASPAELEARLLAQRAALEDPATRRQVLHQLIHRILARRDDDRIVMQIEYAISASGSGSLGAHTETLIAEIAIRKRKAPRR